MKKWQAALILFAVALTGAARAQFEESSSNYPYPVPQGLDKPSVPKENPLTDAKAALGRLLYFDKRLSRDGTISCATCHDPRKGWTDQRPTSSGIRGQLGKRNAPTVLNSAYSEVQFWDGRAGSLEEQAKGPIANPIEMGFTHEAMVGVLSGVKGYAPRFQGAFGDPQVTLERVAQAIASFERTVLTGDAPYDRYSAGDKTAMGADAVRGMGLFFGKANCSVCHTGKSFSDGDFHNIGVGMSRRSPDLGRYAVTKADKDRGAFKTPILRNLADTFPYMHDGSQKTLEEVVRFYDKGGEPNKWLDKDIRPLGLSDQEKKDLIAFLGALNGSKPAIEAPRELPR